MKFDVLYLPTYVPELDGDVATFYGHMLEQIVLADKLSPGFSTVWLTEHHFSPYGGTLPNPAVLGAAIASRTRRIRIGTAVTVLPLHNPLLVAEDFAMLDVLSGGRLDFGIGRGSVQVEFQEFGVDYAESAQAMVEAIDVILNVWTSDVFSRDGHKTIELLPKPVQRPHPPVWVGASRTPETFAWAGRRGYNLMVLPYMLPPADLRERLQLYREAAAEAGHDPRQLKIMGKFHVFVGDSLEAVSKVAGPAYDNYQRLAGSRSQHGPQAYWRAGADWDKHRAECRVIGGTPADCRATIDYWQQTLELTNIGGTFHFGGLDQAATLESLELFAREVAPHFSLEASVL